MESPKQEATTQSFNSFPFSKQPLFCFIISADGRNETTTTAMVCDISSLMGRPYVIIPCAGLGQAVSINGMILSFIYRHMVSVDEKIMPMYEYVAECKKRKLSPHVRALWIEDDIMLSPRQSGEIAEMIKYVESTRCTTPNCKHEDSTCTAVCRKCPRGLNIVAPYSTGNMAVIRDEPMFCDHCGQQELPENFVYFLKPVFHCEKDGDFPIARNFDPSMVCPTCLGQGEIRTGRSYTVAEIRALKPYQAIEGLAGLGFYYGDIFLDYVWYEGLYNGQTARGLPSYSGIDWNYFLDNNIHLHHYPIIVLHEKAKMFSNYKVLGLTEERAVLEPEVDFLRYFEPTKKSVYVEIGASQGSTALKLPKETRKILIEALPENVKTIRRLMTEGYLANTMLIDRAISSEKGVADFKVTPKASLSQLVNIAYNMPQTVECPIISVKTDTLESILDSIAETQKLDQIDLLAADIPNPVDILEHSGKWLSKVKNFAMATYGQEKELARILNNAGYRTKVEHGISPQDERVLIYGYPPFAFD
jgi:FkbM family methyltransferase